MRLRLASAAFAFSAAISVEARAQEQPPGDIVIRGEAPVRSASETVRDRRALSNSPHHTGSEMLLSVPGMALSQHSGEGKAHQIFFRGFDALHGQDLEIWVAGAPVNEVSNVHGQGYADLHFVMPELVRELKAQPGTYDPRQGDFAVAGTLGFELGYPVEGLSAKGTMGSFGTRRAFVAYRPPDTSEANFAAAELQRTDGFGEGRAADRVSAMGQLELPLRDGYVVRLMASSFAARFGSAGVLRLEDIESGRTDRFDSYDTDQGGRSERTQIVASMQRARARTAFGFSSYFVRRSLLLRSNYTGYLDDPLLGDSTQQLNEASTLGFRGWMKQAVSIFSDSDAVEFGVSARSDWIEQAQRRLSSLDDRVTRSEVDALIRAANIAGYADLDLHPLRRVRLRGGLRADGIAVAVSDGLAEEREARSAQGTHLGAKASLEVGLAIGLTAVASYGEGFRSPQARSLQDGERTPFTTVRSQELGLRFRDAAALTAAVAVYRTTLSDDLVFDEARARNVEAPATVRVGAVLDVAARPNEWFTSAFSTTYTHASFREADDRYRAGDLVPFVPQLVMRAELSFSPRVARFAERDLMVKVGVGSSWVYRRPIPYGELGSDLMLVDALAGARLGAFELSVDAFNLLGRQFYDGEFVYASNFQRGSISSEIPARHVTAGAPRTFLISFAVHI